MALIPTKKHFMLLHYTNIKVFGTQLYLVFPLHTPEETSMRPSLTADKHFAWWQYSLKKIDKSAGCSPPKHLFDCDLKVINMKWREIWLSSSVHLISCNNDFFLRQNFFFVIFLFTWSVTKTGRRRCTSGVQESFQVGHFVL